MRRELHREFLKIQEIDVFGLSLACTKHSFQVTDINDLEKVLHQAFAIALEGRQGQQRRFRSS